MTKLAIVTKTRNDERIAVAGYRKRSPYRVFARSRCAQNPPRRSQDHENCSNGGHFLRMGGDHVMFERTGFLQTSIQRRRTIKALTDQRGRRALVPIARTHQPALAPRLGLVAVPARRLGPPAPARPSAIGQKSMPGGKFEVAGLPPFPSHDFPFKLSGWGEFFSLTP